jgi:hypothetical protein
MSNLATQSSQVMGPSALAEENEKERYPILADSTGFQLWLVQVEAILVAKGVWKFVCPPEDRRYLADPRIRLLPAKKENDTDDDIDEKAEKEIELFDIGDAKAKTILFRAVAKNQKAIIQAYRTGREMLTVLKRFYASTNEQHQRKLTIKFNTMKLSMFKSMIEYLAAFKTVILELESVGIYKSEREIILQMQDGLTDEYNVFREIHQSMLNETLADYEYALLLAADARNRLTVDLTSDGPKESVLRVNTGNNSPKFKGKCHNCGKVGHKKAQCRKPKTESQNNSDTQANVKLIVEKVR